MNEVTATAPQTDDLTGSARIRNAAFALFAKKGFDATSVRDIARTADVSPALVFHHFGSKDGLRHEIDAALLEQMRGVVRDARRRTPDADPEQQLLWRLEAIAASAQTAPELVAYLGRSLLEGSEISAALFQRMVDLMIEDLDELEAAGVARRSDDQAARALLLLFLEFGPLLLRDYLETALGAPAFAPESVARWVRACSDVLTHGVLTPTDDTGESDDRDRE